MYVCMYPKQLSNMWFEFDCVIIYFYRHITSTDINNRKNIN